MPELQTQTGSDHDTVLALRLGPDDDVAVLTADATSDAQVRVDRDVIRAIQDIARGHKIALRPIAAGDPVRKYGQIIGFATATVSTGEHVHSHNLEFRAFSRAHVPGAGAKTTGFVAESDRLSFDGIVRADGRVATRNYLGILTSVNCSATVARLIARHFSHPGVLDEFPGVDGIVALTHTGGCGMDGHGEGLKVLRRTLTGFARHPNFAGVLLVGLGCEDNQVDALAEAWSQPASTPIRVMTIQDEGGTTATVDKGIACLSEMLPEAAAATRRAVRARPRAPVRGLGLVFGHHRQPRTRCRSRSARRPGWHSGAGGNARDLRGRASAHPPCGQPRGGGQASRAHRLVGVLHGY
jgi:altronate hydrolase